jgi:hypothetical protein
VERSRDEVELPSLRAGYRRGALAAIPLLAIVTFLLGWAVPGAADFRGGMSLVMFFALMAVALSQSVALRATINRSAEMAESQ